MQVVGDQPVVGDRVLVAAVEGRKGDMVALVAQGAHTHDASDITSGVLDPARLPLVSGEAPGAMVPGDKAKLDGLVVDSSAGTRVVFGGQTIFYDSGWRNISGYLTSSMDAGSVLLVRRTVTDVYFYFSGAFGSSGGASVMNDSLPSGWRPYFTTHPQVAYETQLHGLDYLHTGRLRWKWSYDLETSTHSESRPTSPITVAHSLIAEDHIPDSLIGDPA
ncbi:hypothetical protein [Nesterenkonia suensis]